MARLSVVIPVLNEASHLPMLLADLACLDPLTAGLEAEVLVVDGGSRDGSATVAQLGGAAVAHSPPGRGLQLQHGAARARGGWLWFLHADCRLPPGWCAAVAAVVAGAGRQADTCAWCFDLAIEGQGSGLRCVEIGVRLRTRLLQRPYGDQGLLLSRALYERVGGFAGWPLMEDLEFVERLCRQARILPIGLPLRCSGRRWRQHGVLRTTWLNHRLRWRWRRGDPPELLARIYHGRCPRP
jgi:rSAM/selenodomain-associated transferase 2